jgi:hypothetical protein
MFILGILGLLQMTILPGWVWLRAARIRTRNPCEEGIYCFAASLILNHWLVYLLSTIGQNNRIAWLTIMVVEAVLLAIITRPSTVRRLVPLPSAESSAGGPTFMSVSLTSLAVVSLLAFVPILFENWGTVFSSNDDVASWDRWAQDWFLNRFPAGTDLYPQLLPANWSITYALMGTLEVKMFAKAIMPLFAVSIPLLFVSLAWNRRDRVYLAGCFIMGFLFLQYLGRDFLMTGYADIALAFFCFLAFYVLYDEEAGSPGSTRFVSLFFATGAAITKQGGLLALAAVIVYLMATRKSSRDQNAAAALRWTVWIAVTFVALWYFPKFYDVFRGQSRIHYILHDIHEGRNYFARLGYGCRLLMRAGDRPGVLLFGIGAALTLSALLFSKTRKLAIGIALPAFVLWGVFFSYEVRTAALLLPFFALVWCLSLECVGRKAFRNRMPLPWRGPAAYWLTATVLIGTGVMLYYSGEAVPRMRINFTWPMILVGACTVVAPIVEIRRRLRIEISVPALAASLVLLAGLVAWPRYSYAELLGQQLTEERRIGNPIVNARLYRLYDDGELNQPIFSTYWFLLSLPQLKSLNRTMSCGDCSVPSLFSAIARNRDVKFVLLEDATLPASATGIIAHCAGIDTVFVEGTVSLFRVDRSKLPETCSVDSEAIRPIIEKLYPGETLAGRAFNVQPNGVAAFGVASRNASSSSFIFWAGTELVSIYGGPKVMSAEVPHRLYEKPGHYPIEIVDKATGLRSPPVNFVVK